MPAPPHPRSDRSRPSRAAGSVAVVLLGATLGCDGAPTEVEPAGMPAPPAHEIRVVHSGLCVEASPAGAVQSSCMASAAQSWTFVGGYPQGFEIRRPGGDGCLSVGDRDTHDDAPPCPRYLLDDLGEGRHRLVHTETGRCLGVMDGAGAAGAPLEDRTCGQRAGEHFELRLSRDSPLRYRNPIEAGPAPLEQIRDPQVIRVNGTYYMTGTSSPFWNGPNDGVRIRSSIDLIRWTVGHPVVSPHDSSWCKERFWAPELFAHRGRYYLTVNCRATPDASLGTLVAVGEAPGGPYRVLNPHAPLVLGNDAHVFEDRDGRVYLFTSGIRVHEVTLDPLAVLGPGRLVLAPGPTGTWDAPGIEGPSVLERGGVYMLFYSSWGRGYEVGVATAPSVWGPWTKQADNPVYGACTDNTRCGRPAATPFSGVGHGSPFEGPDGGLWLSSHGTGGTLEGPALLVLDRIDLADGRVTAAVTWTEQVVSVR